MPPAGSQLGRRHDSGTMGPGRRADQGVRLQPEPPASGTFAPEPPASGAFLSGPPTLSAHRPGAPPPIQERVPNEPQALAATAAARRSARGNPDRPGSG